MTHSPEVLAAAMAKVSRDAYWWPSPWMYSSLLRTSAPPKPPTTPTTEIVPAEPYEAPAPVAAAPAAVERLGGISMRLDISVWRLPYLWRLVASFVVRRLGR